MGKAAWEAYAASFNYKTFDGKPLPAFEELSQLQQDGWAEVARQELAAATALTDEPTE